MMQLFGRLLIWEKGLTSFKRLQFYIHFNFFFLCIKKDLILLVNLDMYIFFFFVFKYMYMLTMLSKTFEYQTKCFITGIHTCFPNIIASCVWLALWSKCNKDERCETTDYDMAVTLFSLRVFTLTHVTLRAGPGANMRAWGWYWVWY